MNKLPCDDCKWHILQDDGYSNWTVMGTTSHCLLGKREPVDHWWGEPPELDGFECKVFDRGQGFHFDVDCEDKDWRANDPEKEWAAWLPDDEPRRSLLLRWLTGRD